LTNAPSTWDMTPRQRIAWVLGSFVALALLFRFVPQVDLAVAALFHDELGFSPGRKGLNGVFYWIGDTGAEILFVALTLAMFGGILRLGRLAAWRARLVFLWLALFIGPGLVVNLVLKAEIDRPRPSQIVEFGGEQPFVAAFDWRDTDARGHSFVSGHAAFAFQLMALGWVFARHRRRWLFAALGFGAAMGLTRMDGGQHFLSDVVFAFYVVYGCTAFAWWLTGKLVPPDPRR
jgi:lipid A 4'-phosphatase